MRRKSAYCHCWFNLFPLSPNLSATSVSLHWQFWELTILSEEIIYYYRSLTVNRIQVINFCTVFCHVLQMKLNLVPSRKTLLRPWSPSALHRLALLLLLHVLLHHRGHLHHQVTWWHTLGDWKYFVLALWDELWSSRPKAPMVWGSTQPHQRFLNKIFISQITLR